MEALVMAQEKKSYDLVVDITKDMDRMLM